MNESIYYVADLLHSLLCNKDHTYDPVEYAIEDKQKCGWYVEEGIENIWDQCDHAIWLDLAIAFISCMQEKTSEQELKEITGTYITVAQKLFEAQTRWPKLLPFIEELIKNE